MLLLPEYYGCLAETEKTACRYALDSVVPPFIYVIPKGAMDDFFASRSDNFPLRQVWWASMFRFQVETIEILPGIEREVYVDPFGFIDQWRMYTWVHGGWPPTTCRIRDYHTV